MRLFCNSIPSAVVMLAVTFAAAPIDPAGAQQPPAANGGLQVLVTPYFWLAGVNATITTPLPRAPEVNASVSAADLLGHLDALPFLGSAEIRDGPLSLLGDVIHLPVGTNITTRNVFFNGGNAALTANTGTALLLYHVLDQPVQSLDAGGGFRAWGFSAGLTLNGGLLPTASANRTAEWADPLVAARYHREFGNGFGLTAYGDVGGFDVSGAHVDWQIIGTLDYAPRPWVTLRLGYRSLNFNYQSTEAVGFNVHMKGPLLAATFRF